jgi:hypothetical protein
MFSGGKGGQCLGLTTLPLLCADCLEIWEPQPPGTLMACPGLQWDCFTFTLCTVFLLTKMLLLHYVMIFCMLPAPWSFGSVSGFLGNWDDPSPHIVQMTNL